MPQCAPVDSGVAVLAASSQRGPLCFTSGLDSRQTIWESLTGSLDEVIEWRAYSCAVYFLYFFSAGVLYCFLSQCSSHTNLSHCLKKIFCCMRSRFVQCRMNHQYFEPQCNDIVLTQLWVSVFLLARLAQSSRFSYEWKWINNSENYLRRK